MCSTVVFSVNIWKHEPNRWTLYIKYKRWQSDLRWRVCVRVKEMCYVWMHFFSMCLCCCHQCLTINQRPSGRGIAQLVAPCVITKLTFKQQQPYFTLASAGRRVVYGWSKSFQQQKKEKSEKKKSIRDRMHSNALLMDPHINYSTVAILSAH